MNGVVESFLGSALWWGVCAWVWGICRYLWKVPARLWARFSPFARWRRHSVHRSELKELKLNFCNAISDIFDKSLNFRPQALVYCQHITRNWQRVRDNRLLLPRKHFGLDTAMQIHQPINALKLGVERLARDNPDRGMIRELQRIQSAIGNLAVLEKLVSARSAGQYVNNFLSILHTHLSSEADHQGLEKLRTIEVNERRWSEIEERVAPNVEISREHWIDYIKDYVVAFEEVAESTSSYFRPHVFVFGQTGECLIEGDLMIKNLVLETVRPSLQQLLLLSHT